MIIPKGHMSFHHCRTYHGSAANRSGRPRRAISFHLQDGDNAYRPFTLSNGDVVAYNHDVAGPAPRRMAAPTTPTPTSARCCGATPTVRVTDIDQQEVCMSRYDWGQRHPGIDRLEEQINGRQDKVVSHPLYAALDNHHAIRTFLEHHVFAVWDFMSLLKSLQRNLTCVDAAVGADRPDRQPPPDQRHRAGRGERRARRRFHQPLRALHERHDRGRRRHLGDRPSSSTCSGRSGRCGTRSRDAKVPAPAAEFVRSPGDFIENAPIHSQAAAFAFGREDLIPDMFQQVVDVNERVGSLDTFVDYLERHIEVDGE